MPLVTEPRQTKPSLKESWLGGSYTLGTSRETWPEMVRELEKQEEMRCDKPVATLLLTVSTLAFSALGMTAYERLNSAVASIAKWLQKSAPAQVMGDELLPDVEYMVCPESPPKHTIRLEGYVRSIQRGREDFTLSDDDLVALPLEEVDA